MITVGMHNEKTRVEWIKKTLKKIPKGSRILDAGAGEQQFKKFCSHLEYVSQDFAKYNGKGDNRGLQTKIWNNSNLDIVSDITSIPVPDHSFDAIMCTEVFEHISDPVLAIQEFSRIIKKGGYLLLTAPFCSLTHFSPFHYYSGFNKYFYNKHLSNFGFKIVEIKNNGNYFEYLAQEIRRLPSMQTKYTFEQKPNILELIAIKIILYFLEKSSKKDRKSNELLCFGYQVFARKIKNQ